MDQKIREAFIKKDIENSIINNSACLWAQLHCTHMMCHYGRKHFLVQFSYFLLNTTMFLGKTLFLRSDGRIFTYDLLTVWVSELVMSELSELLSCHGAATPAGRASRSPPHSSATNRHNLDNKIKDSSGFVRYTAFQNEGKNSHLNIEYENYNLLRRSLFLVTLGSLLYVCHIQYIEH